MVEPGILRGRPHPHGGTQTESKETDLKAGVEEDKKRKKNKLTSTANISQHFDVLVLYIQITAVLRQEEQSEGLSQGDRPTDNRSLLPLAESFMPFAHRQH
jgi:hypothetical protein